MNGIFVILFIVAAFHLCLYYCNLDFFTKKTPVTPAVSVGLDPVELSETKEKLEKHLNELKQVSNITAHG
jgi:hypothetical protein